MERGNTKLKHSREVWRQAVRKKDTNLGFELERNGMMKTVMEKLEELEKDKKEQAQEMARVMEKLNNVEVEISGEMTKRCNHLWKS